MATLKDLVETAAAATLQPEATVFAYGRFAREAGFIAQKGRGKNAAEMTVRDAANLLIALGGTGITRDAAKTIRAFRALRGHLLILRDEFEPLIRNWLGPLGLRDRGREVEIKADLGTTLEFLMGEAGTGNLHRLLGQFPTYELSNALWRQWKREGSENLDVSVDELIRRGLIEPGFDKQAALRQFFYRDLHAVDLQLVRQWGYPEEVAMLRFCTQHADWNEIFENSTPYRLVAQFDEQCLTGLAFALQNIKFPSRLWPVDFFDYFKVPEIKAKELALRSPARKKQGGVK
jgi:hypothetical protein